MMATLDELRSAIVERLTAELSSDWTVYRLPPDNIDAPAVMVMGFDLQPSTFGDATNRVEVELLVAVSRRHVDQVDLLDEVLSPSAADGLWQLFDTDPSLGGTVGHCVVQAVGDYRQIVVADLPYYAATVQLTAMV